MTKEAVEQLVNELAATVLDKRAGVSASQPAASQPGAGGFDIGALIQRLRAWFAGLPSERRNAVIYSLIGAGATGLVSVLTGGNVLLDTALGAGMGGLGGYAGTRAHQYFTQPGAFDQLTSEQQRALHRAGEGPGLLRQAVPHVGAATGGAAGGLAAHQGWSRYRTGRDAFRSLFQPGPEGLPSPSDITGARAKLQMAVDKAKRAPNAASGAIAKHQATVLRDLLGRQETANYYANLSKPRQWLANLGIRPGMEKAINENVYQQMSPYKRPSMRGAVGQGSLGKGFRNLLMRAATKGGKGRLGWLALPAAAAGGYSVYNQLADGQGQ